MDILLNWLESVVNNSGTAKDLTTSLTDYNAMLWEYSQSVANNVVKPISLTVLAFFLLLEFGNLYKKIDSGGGSFHIQLLVPIFIKLAFAKLLMDNFSVVILAIQGLAIMLIQRMQTVLPTMNAKGTVNITSLKDAVDDLGFLEQVWAGIIILITVVVAWIANWIARFAIVMRFFEMYLLTAIAPLPIAAIPSDEYNQWTKNFFKLFGAISLSTVLMYLVLSFYSVLGSSIVRTTGTDFISLTMSILAYNIFLIFLVVRTYSLSKSLIGVNA